VNRHNKTILFATQDSYIKCQISSEFNRVTNSSAESFLDNVTFSTIDELSESNFEADVLIVDEADDYFDSRLFMENKKSTSRPLGLY
jgi:hypothetical protein